MLLGGFPSRAPPRPSEVMANTLYPDRPPPRAPGGPSRGEDGGTSAGAVHMVPGQVFTPALPCKESLFFLPSVPTTVPVFPSVPRSNPATLRNQMPVPVYPVAPVLARETAHVPLPSTHYSSPQYSPTPLPCAASKDHSVTKRPEAAYQAPARLAPETHASDINCGLPANPGRALPTRPLPSTLVHSDSAPNAIQRRLTNPLACSDSSFPSPPASPGTLPDSRWEIKPLSEILPLFLCLSVLTLLQKR